MRERPIRYCFDPQRHPEMPYHRHPPAGRAREPWRRVDPEGVLEAVEALAVNERVIERL